MKLSLVCCPDCRSSSVRGLINQTRALLVVKTPPKTPVREEAYRANNIGVALLNNSNIKRPRMRFGARCNSIRDSPVGSKRHCTLQHADLPAKAEREKRCTLRRMRCNRIMSSACSRSCRTNRRKQSPRFKRCWRSIRRMLARM